jgi:hypothetical protein
MTRHLGRHKETNEQAVVVWMLLPQQTTHALVVYPDRMKNPTLRNALMTALGTGEAQRADVLGDVLGRQTFADSQRGILQVLHETQSLHRTPIDDIDMTPDGNHRIPLRAVLEAIGWLAASAGGDKFNPHTYNAVRAGAGEENVAKAQNLLVEADLLEGDAARKRAQAYAIAPSLNPNAAAPAAPEAPAAETPVSEPPASEAETSPNAD